MNVDGICFVDTNVLVYAFDRTDDLRRQRAAELVQQLAATNRIVLSTQVLQEFFVTVTKKIKNPLEVKQALEIIRDLASWSLFTVDLQAIIAAGNLSNESKISFRDALIVISAKRFGAKVIYTEDLNHGQEILGVSIVNPFKQPSW